jgi:hypothetical protein
VVVGVRKFVSNWPTWLQVLALVGSAFGICTVCSWPASVVAVALYLESHPEWRVEVAQWSGWLRVHWAGLAVGVVLLALLGAAVWFRDYVRWAPRGFAAWVRWCRLDRGVRSKLEGLSPHAKEILVSTVRVGKPWQGGRLSVDAGDVYGFLVLRSRGEWKWHSGAGMGPSLEEVREAGFVTFVPQGPGQFLVTLSRDCGSRERLAELLEAQLVKQRVWKP